MLTKTKRQIAIPAALWKDLDQLARREGKSIVAALQDLVVEKRRSQLKQEYRAIQGYWSKKAKAKPKQMESKVEIDSDVVLARARAVRRTPQGIQLTDRLLRSFRGS